MAEYLRFSDTCTSLLEGVTIGQVLDAHGEGRWHIRVGTTHYLFGNAGLREFRGISFALRPYGMKEFLRSDPKGRFPCIMNYYVPSVHAPAKRAHAQAFDTGLVRGFQECVRHDVRKRLRALCGTKNDLCEELTTLIIQSHCEFFIGQRIDLESAQWLFYFEDVYTLALNSSREDREILFSARTFRKAEQTFGKIVDSPCAGPSVIGETVTEMQAHGVSRKSAVYNFTIAGSANVAKVACYALALLDEAAAEERGALMQVARGEGVAAAARLVYEETLRLLPLLRNQVTGPYLMRECSDDVQLSDGTDISEGDSVLYVHALVNYDPHRFPRPTEFRPTRVSAGEPTTARPFGVGEHACCGAKLATIWLAESLACLLSEYTFRPAAPLTTTPYDHRVPAVERTSYTGTLVAVVPSHESSPNHPSRS